MRRRVAAIVGKEESFLPFGAFVFGFGACEVADLQLVSFFPGVLMKKKKK